MAFLPSDDKASFLWLETHFVVLRLGGALVLQLLYCPRSNRPPFLLVWDVLLIASLFGPKIYRPVYMVYIIMDIYVMYIYMIL